MQESVGQSFLHSLLYGLPGWGDAHQAPEVRGGCEAVRKLSLGDSNLLFSPPAILLPTPSWKITESVPIVRVVSLLPKHWLRHAIKSLGIYVRESFELETVVFGASEYMSEVPIWLKSYFKTGLPDLSNTWRRRAHTNVFLVVLGTLSVCFHFFLTETVQSGMNWMLNIPAHPAKGDVLASNSQDAPRDSGQDY